MMVDDDPTYSLEQRIYDIKKTEQRRRAKEAEIERKAK